MKQHLHFFLPIILLIGQSNMALASEEQSFLSLSKAQFTLGMVGLCLTGLSGWIMYYRKNDKYNELKSIANNLNNTHNAKNSRDRQYRSHNVYQDKIIFGVDITTGEIDESKIPESVKKDEERLKKEEEARTKTERIFFEKLNTFLKNN